MAAHRSLLLLLPLLASLLLRNAAANTILLRLIHHFSDEAKALKASRSTGDAKWLGRWPWRNSMDYYHLLVNTDFHRQKMKLAAIAFFRHHQFQFLFPSEGSNTASFGNDFG
ncbi:putative aspartic peptidase A1 family [Rosa chinensis]|uniref:Putative aspartic peptidase A1 family n=1 Tax=Rosa chinensis TaxID=74649 RepID=A0A2P6SFZ4_ROSCH|nr:putative aspartic peptidase A1 family [Rosa chinensis]